MKPLIFCPSPRDIPQVKRQWHQLPYDKFIVKYKPQLEAYTEGREFFLKHNYTHFIMCPDDLVVTKENLEKLIKNVKNPGYETIAGICNIDETQMDTYAVKPLGIDMTRQNPDTTFGSWYMKDKKPILPQNEIIQVSHAGFPLQIISRELMEKVSWVGSTTDKKGNFDWQFSKDCHKLGVPIYCDTSVNSLHLRHLAWEQVRKYKESGFPEGYSFLLRY